MKKIVVITSTRAEYGLLAPIIKKLSRDSRIETFVAATGMHLSPEFGMTINDIEVDGVKVDKQIEILMSSDSSVGVSKSMGLAMISFAEYFAERKPDAIMVLGDRFETLAVCIAAMNCRIPIIHLHGGEATEGLIDEAIRNSITKLSYLHFPSTEIYRKRIIQMGESPDRVYNVGAMGVENAVRTVLLSKEQLSESLNCELDKYAVMTFHPVTLENNTAESQTKEVLDALVEFSDIQFICTKANADMNGRIINTLIEEYSKHYPNIHLYDSLGMKRYLSALKYAEFVIGNSSSGIIEAPSFGIPTINIGDRQKGRIQSETVINCAPNKKDIIDAMTLAGSTSFKARIMTSNNPYGDGETSDKIVRITTDYLLNDIFEIKKSFYDLWVR